MERPEYYENPVKTDEDIKQNRQRRGKFGSYAATSIISMIIGALLASMFLPLVYTTRPDSGGQWGAATPTPEINGQYTPGPVETYLPDNTPPYTERPMIGLDGEAPVISDKTNPIPEIAEAVGGGVVGIGNYAESILFPSWGGGDTLQGTGSGFVISSEGYIVTNAHVVEGAKTLTVTFNDGKEYPAQLIGADYTMDIAVLHVSTGAMNALKIGDSDKTRVGEFAIAIGDPTGRELAGTTTFGIISATKRTVNISGHSNVYIQTDAAINPGNSGGPLLNMNGEVIGITSAKTVTASYDERGNAISAEGLGFAIPINEALGVIEQLITQGYIQRPGIGASTIEIDAQNAQIYQITPGILIYSMIKDGPAHKSGLQIDDVVVECDGKTVLTSDEFSSAIKSKKVGDSIAMRVWRGGRYIDITLVIGDLNTLGSEQIKGDSILDD